MSKDSKNSHNIAIQTGLGTLSVALGFTTYLDVLYDNQFLGKSEDGWENPSR